jgi:hypothetical protein
VKLATGYADVILEEGTNSGELLQRLGRIWELRGKERTALFRSITKSSKGT